MSQSRLMTNLFCSVEERTFNSKLFATNSKCKNPHFFAYKLIVMSAVNSIFKVFFLKFPLENKDTFNVFVVIIFLTM